MKRLLYVIVFIVIWVGCLVGYASVTDSFSENTALLISGVLVVIYIFATRGLRRVQSSVDHDQAMHMMTGQAMAQHDMDDSDSSGSGDSGGWGGDSGGGGDDGGGE